MLADPANQPRLHQMQLPTNVPEPCPPLRSAQGTSRLENHNRYLQDVLGNNLQEPFAHVLLLSKAFSINVKAGVTNRGDVGPGLTDAVRLKQLKDLCSALLREDPFPAIDFQMPQQDEQVFTEYKDHCLPGSPDGRCKFTFEEELHSAIQQTFQPLPANLREFLDVLKGDQFAWQVCLIKHWLR
jgi:hypothetical protein